MKEFPSPPSGAWSTGVQYPGLRFTSSGALFRRLLRRLKKLQKKPSRNKQLPILKEKEALGADGIKPRVKRSETRGQSCNLPKPVKRATENGARYSC